MNSAARKFARDLEEDVAAKGGLEGFRMHALKNMELKTIIRVGVGWLVKLLGSSIFTVIRERQRLVAVK